jgi:hypothetical protein
VSWFTFLKATDSATPELATEYSPVRRKMVFPNVTDNLKIGDWIHVNISDYDIGRLFYYENGLIKDKVDQDSYIVVYENNDEYIPTYSIILGGESENEYDKNLWFKSVTDVTAGNQPDGNYYIYYHKDNIQYIELSSSSYVSTTPPSGSNYMAIESGESTNSLSFYSHQVLAGSTNTRKASVAYLGDPETWFSQSSSAPGAKAIGSFSGPVFKLFTKVGPDFGKIKIKVIKTSATGSGQQVVSQSNEIDLYSSVLKSEENVFSFDVRTLNLFSTYDEIYGDFIFELEILDEKNQSSSGNKLTIEKYSFSKNYFIQLEDEEIKPDIAFKSIGGLK